MREPMRALSLFFLLFGVFVAASSLSVRPAHAAADVAMNTYLAPDGSRNFIDNGGTMPVGSTLRISVFADFNSCDPVTVYWGDGTSQSRNYGGAFAQTWDHTYNAAGTYTIKATEPCGSQGAVRSVNVGSAGLFGGSGLGVFDPSGPLFAPTLFGLLFGLIGLGLALGNSRIPGASMSASLDPRSLRIAPTPTGPSGINPTIVTPTQVIPTVVEPTVVTPREVTPTVVTPTPVNPTGILSMAEHLVSYRDIPPGAPRQLDPHHGTCACGGQLGYVAGGWFCLNEKCPLIKAEQPWPRVVHGL